MGVGSGGEGGGIFIVDGDGFIDGYAGCADGGGGDGGGIFIDGYAGCADGGGGGKGVGGDMPTWPPSPPPGKQARPDQSCWHV